MPRAIFLIISLLTLTSCVSVQHYPSHWSPPLHSDTECARIAGEYKDYGEWAKDRREGEKVRFSLLLFPTWTMVYEDSITHVEINQESNNIIKVSVWSDKKMVSEKTYSRSNNDFSCESGWTSIKVPAHRMLWKFALGVDWGVVRLARSADGDLIVRVGYSHIGLFSVIPFAETGSSWCRFYEIRPDIGSNSAQEEK